MKLMAIDPGSAHCGVAYFDDHKMLWSGELEPYELHHRLRNLDIDRVVCEEYRVYPWMAQQHGFSTVPTVEVIGTIKYICADRGIPVVMQPALILNASRARFRTVLVSRNKHARDAECHGRYWMAREEEDENGW